MAGPYSIDLRQKVITFISKGNTTKEAARVFFIGRDTVNRWILLHKKGDLHPKKRIQHPTKVDPEKLKIFLQENNDKTLDEIAHALNLGRTTVFRWLNRLCITRKKRPRCTPNATKKSEKSSGNTLQP